jgi:surface protein
MVASLRIRVACAALVVISRLCAAQAAAFTSSAALKTAVENCLAAVSSGENCCSAGGADCGAAGSADMPDWDVSLVTNMEDLFKDKYDFNQDISRWNTASVTSMRQMFAQATRSRRATSRTGTWARSRTCTACFRYGSNDDSFSNLDLSRWNVGEVTDMGSMFSSAHGFNSDISGWDVSKVTSMNSMFSYARNFTGDLSRWDVGEVTDMSYMFYEAESFNSDISGWDVSKVQQMYSMFERAVAFSQDITGWSFDDSAYADDTMVPAYVRIAERMFSGATAFFGSYTNCGYDDSDTSVCTGTYEASNGMFDGPPGAWEVGASIGCINSVPSPFKTSAALWLAVEHCLAAVSSGENCCSAGGADCGAACATDMPDWDVSLVTNMDELFRDKSEFNQDISRWNTASVTSMRQMFCAS